MSWLVILILGGLAVALIWFFISTANGPRQQGVTRDGLHLTPYTAVDAGLLAQAAREFGGSITQHEQFLAFNNFYAYSAQIFVVGLPVQLQERVLRPDGSNGAAAPTRGTLRFSVAVTVEIPANLPTVGLRRKRPTDQWEVFDGDARNLPGNAWWQVTQSVGATELTEVHIFPSGPGQTRLFLLTDRKGSWRLNHVTLPVLAGVVAAFLAPSTSVG